MIFFLAKRFDGLHLRMHWIQILRSKSMAENNLFRKVSLCRSREALVQFESDRKLLWLEGSNSFFRRFLRRRIDRRVRPIGLVEVAFDARQLKRLEEHDIVRGIVQLWITTLLTASRSLITRIQVSSTTTQSWLSLQVQL